MSFFNFSYCTDKKIIYIYFKKSKYQYKDSTLHTDNLNNEYVQSPIGGIL